jgi:hypothetical protein
MIAARISAEQVQAFVHQYWRVLMDKTPGEMEKLYTYDSTIFNPFAQRPEPGRVSAARKEREYFENQTSFRAEVTSPIEAMLLADNVAVATYAFRWQATGMMERVGGKRCDKAVRNGRATEVIVLDSEGKLRIAHQHHSDIWRDTKQNP